MSTLDLNAVMDGLGVRLATISGLRVFDYPTDQLEPPAAVVGLPLEVAYDYTKGRGSDRALFPVFVVVGGAFARAARDALGPYLAGAGSSSIKAAIEADRTLAGACATLGVANVRSDGSGITVNGVRYTGAIFEVEVTS